MRLLAAAADLYRQGGLAALTTDTVARLAGTSKRALYEHFAGRDGVLEALLLARLDRLEADLDALERASVPVDERIRRFTELAAALPREFPPGFWAELVRGSPGVAASVRTRRDTIARGALTRLLQAGVRAGDIRSDVPLPLLVHLAEATAESLLTREPPPGFGPLSLAEAGIAVMLEGLLTRR